MKVICPSYMAKNYQPAQGWWKQDWTIVVLSTLCMVVNNIDNTVEPESGVTMLNNIVDNIE